MERIIHVTSFPLEILARLDGPHGCYFSSTVLVLSLLLYIVHYRGTSNRSRKMEGGPEVITVKETREERAGVRCGFNRHRHNY